MATLAGSGTAQSIPFDIRPSRVEAEVNPGTEKTVSFVVKTGAGSGPSRETVTMDLTDWTTQEDGSLKYTEPGSIQNSAAAWIKFSPSAFAVIPSTSQLVRITISVPADAAPGVYRSGIFLQQRPPAALPTVKEPTVLLRVRYAFFLYVIVPPVQAHAELTGIQLGTQGDTVRLGYEMKNSGTLHVRPMLRWAVRNAQGDMTGTPGQHETTVLLPHSTLREFFEFPAKLPPGRYQVAVMVDFRDGKPLQSISQQLDVPNAPDKPVAQAN